MNSCLWSGESASSDSPATALHFLIHAKRGGEALGKEASFLHPSGLEVPAFSRCCRAALARSQTCSVARATTGIKRMEDACGAGTAAP